MPGKIPDVSDRLSSIDGRLRKIEGRLGKIEKRLDKIEKPHSRWLTPVVASGFAVFLAGWVGALESLMARNQNFITDSLCFWFVVMLLGVAVMVIIPLVVLWHNSRSGKR